MNRALFVLLIAIAAPNVARGQAAPAQEGANSGASLARLRQLMDLFKTEPSVHDTQRLAVRHYELEPTRINRMARNARLKGLVPDVTVNVDNSVSNSFTNTRDGLYPVLPNINNGNPESLKERTTTTDDRLGWSVNAAWNLDRVVYSAESLDAKSLISMQENLVREVTTLFYSRRRVLASLLMSPPQDEEELFYELMRLDELTATLDAFTGSEFSKKAWKWEEELLK